MKKRTFVAGIMALALLFVTGLAGCASVDQQTLKKEGVPQDQRASLYLVMKENGLERVDGVKQGAFKTLYGALGGLPGTLKDSPRIGQQRSLKRTVQVAPGERTIVVSGPGIVVGRKSYTGTFNFEAGKKYVVRLVTPSEYEAMMVGGVEALAKAGKVLAEGLARNYIIIIAESGKSAPTYYDTSISNDQWIKSINAADSGEDSEEASDE